jgi:Flp pilus assembly pilin Flp
MYIKNKRGQSTVEYILLVTAVVAVIVAFVSGSGGNGFQNQLNATLNSASAEMGSEVTQLDSSHNPSNAVGITAPPYSVRTCPPMVACNPPAGG